MSEEEIQDLINIEEAETMVNSILSSLSDLSEDLGSTIKAAVGSPIKFIKVKNNLKKWVKAKLDITSVDMDAIRKREAAKDDPKGINKEKLETAIKAKKDAIKGKMEDINDRLNDLAVNDSLKAVVRLGKHKASLEANTKLLKIAQGEENDALKLKLEDQIESDKEAITNAENELKTYAKKAEDTPVEKPEEAKPQETKKETKKKKGDTTDSKKEPGETKTDEPNTDSEQVDDKELESAEDKVALAKTEYDKVKDGDDEIVKVDAQIKWQQAKQQVAKLKKDDDNYQGHGDEIGILMQKKQDLLKSDSSDSDETSIDNKEDAKKLTKSQKAKKEKADSIEKQIPELESELKDKQEAHQITIDNNTEAEKNLINAKKEADEGKIKDAEEKYTELQGAVQSESSEITGIEAKIKELKNELSDLKKSFESETEDTPITTEVNEHLSNDISSKFRDLMNKMK